MIKEEILWISQDISFYRGTIAYETMENENA